MKIQTLMLFKSNISECLDNILIKLLNKWFTKYTLQFYIVIVKINIILNINSYSNRNCYKFFYFIEI